MSAVRDTPWSTRERTEPTVPFEQNDNEEEMDDADAKQKEKAGRNGVCGTALAIISTIMGGGIVSIPYAYAVAGVTIGISV